MQGREGDKDEESILRMFVVTILNQQKASQGQLKKNVY